MPRTVRDMMKLVESSGWKQVGHAGSHRQYEHPERPGRVTISGKLSSEVHPKTERSILRQAGLIGGVQ